MAERAGAACSSLLLYVPAANSAVHLLPHLSNLLYTSRHIHIPLDVHGQCIIPTPLGLCLAARGSLWISW